MLGEDLERNIRDAWLRIRRQIVNDPLELQRRLARRRTKTLTRPPRAWCIAIRASDRRITPAHWVITPRHAMDLDHPLHPYEPIEHEVTIQTHAIRRYCHPVSFSREDAVDVAQMLGVSVGTLRKMRLKGKFYERYIRGLGGKPGRAVPLLEGGGQLLDPCAKEYSPPHPIWGGAWEFLSRMMPPDFEQTVVRRPVFAATFRGRPGLAAYGRTIPEDHAYKDEMKFMGWRWLCPMCGKQVRTIYHPLPVRTLFDSWFTDPVIYKRLCDADLPQPPPPSFACKHCHDIYYFSPIKRDAWNRFITYVTAGMLYGCEVEKPASFIPERKRRMIRQLNRPAPEREKVFEGLKKGWSAFQIARELGKSIHTVRCAMRNICIQEDVADVHALAEKLQFAVSPPFNVFERAAARRIVVKEMLLRDCTRDEISRALGIDFRVINQDIKSIYKLYGIKGTTRGSRLALARKLGVPFISRRDELLKRVQKLKDQRLTYRQIAREMGAPLGTVSGYLHSLVKLQKEPQPATSSESPAQAGAQ
jgi:DNA-binding CsgD family transcriptional regulator